MLSWPFGERARSKAELGRQPADSGAPGGPLLCEWGGERGWGQECVKCATASAATCSTARKPSVSPCSQRQQPAHLYKNSLSTDSSMIKAPKLRAENVAVLAERCSSSGRTRLNVTISSLRMKYCLDSRRRSAQIAGRAGQRQYSVNSRFVLRVLQQASAGCFCFSSNNSMWWYPSGWATRSSADPYVDSVPSGDRFLMPGQTEARFKQRPLSAPRHLR
jgi:hypothetical protein